jgi:Amt family ammonium transporter
MVAAAAFFKTQVTSDIFTNDIFYLLASVFLFLAVVAFGMIDSGLVRRKNLLDTWVQKLLASLFAGLAFLIVGYGVWQWQYNSAFGIANPLGQGIKDWWLGGANMTHVASQLNPTNVPAADNLQVFAVFWFAFAAAMGALIHSATVERVKAGAVYILVIVAAGLVLPITGYLTWGSTSPLTNHGLHDYVGDFSFYIFIGVWALIIAWRAGPRLGGPLRPHSGTAGPFPHNLGTTAAGVGLLMFAIPFLVIGCGYIIQGTGYFGIAANGSGFGIVSLNIFMSFAGGAITGAILGYWKRNAVFILLGPIAGYVACTAGFDVFKPWSALLISMGGPLALYAVYQLMGRLKIDEQKVVPLTLGPGIYSAIITGFVAWHTHDGGYFGLTGKYAAGHSQITPQWQLIGVAVIVGIAVVTGLIVTFGLEKTIGLRVREDQELAGLDTAYWDMPSAAEIAYPIAEPPATAPADGAAALASGVAPSPSLGGAGGRD